MAIVWSIPIYIRKSTRGRFFFSVSFGKISSMQKKIQEHFRKVDPELHEVLQRIKPLRGIKTREPKEYFFGLCREIISQQLSSKAAEAIYARFLGLLPGEKVTPKNILKLSREKIRGAGLSWAKVDYIRDLALKVEKKEVRLDNLHLMDDNLAIQELTRVKGIGDWTAEMFLMFSLGRQDVFSSGDLGLKKAMQKIYRISDVTKDRAESIALKWCPYRTWACRILWASID